MHLPPNSLLPHGPSVGVPPTGSGFDFGFASWDTTLFQQNYRSYLTVYQNLLHSPAIQQAEIQQIQASPNRLGMHITNLERLRPYAPTKLMQALVSFFSQLAKTLNTSAAPQHTAAQVAQLRQLRDLSSQTHLLFEHIQKEKMVAKLIVPGIAEQKIKVSDCDINTSNVDIGVQYLVTLYVDKEVESSFKSKLRERVELSLTFKLDKVGKPTTRTIKALLTHIMPYEDRRHFADNLKTQSTAYTVTLVDFFLGSLGSAFGNRMLIAKGNNGIDLMKAVEAIETDHKLTAEDFFFLKQPNPPLKITPSLIIQKPEWSDLDFLKHLVSMMGYGLVETPNGWAAADDLSLLRAKQEKISDLNTKIYLGTDATNASAAHLSHLLMHAEYLGCVAPSMGEAPLPKNIQVIGTKPEDGSNILHPQKTPPGTRQYHMPYLSKIDQVQKMQEALSRALSTAQLIRREFRVAPEFLFFHYRGQILDLSSFKVDYEKRYGKHALGLLDLHDTGLLESIRIEEMGEAIITVLPFDASKKDILPLSLPTPDQMASLSFEGTVCTATGSIDSKEKGLTEPAPDLEGHVYVLAKPPFVNTSALILKARWDSHPGVLLDPAVGLEVMVKAASPLGPLSVEPRHHRHQKFRAPHHKDQITFGAQSKENDPVGHLTFINKKGKKETKILSVGDFSVEAFKEEGAEKEPAFAQIKLTKEALHIVYGGATIQLEGKGETAHCTINVEKGTATVNAKKVQFHASEQMDLNAPIINIKATTDLNIECTNFTTKVKNLMKMVANILKLEGTASAEIATNGTFIEKSLSREISSKTPTRFSK
jgi:hypothetical protein